MPITGTVLELDYANVESEILAFIRRVVSEAKAEGVVVGLSGGIDSSVVAELCIRALGKDKVVGVLMPTSFTPKTDMNDAAELARNWGIRVHTVGIDPIVSAVFDSARIQDASKIAQANVRARTRMLINYYFANAWNLLVAGTGDKSEDMIGYFTKYGDGGVDLLPIAHLYKTQVRALGAWLDLPARIVQKPSSPQLWSGHLATDEIPIDYNKLDLVLYGLFEAKLTPEDVAKETGVAKEIIEKVKAKHKVSEHKRNYPPMVRAW